MNDKYPLIEFIYYWNNKGKAKTEEEIKNTLKSYNTAEQAIKDKKTNKLKNYLKEPLKEFFNNKDNHQILIKIFSQDMIDKFVSQDVKWNIIIIFVRNQK